MSHSNGFNCVCNAVENIDDLQKAVVKRCPISCYSNLLIPVQSLGDTIPFLLYTQNSTLFKAFGNVGGDCFQTVFFRVESIHRCSATLRLLLALDCKGHFIEFYDKDNVCKVAELVKTNHYIEVDLSCFCAIQCLSPRLLSTLQKRTFSTI